MLECFWLHFACHCNDVIASGSAAWRSRRSTPVYSLSQSAIDQPVPLKYSGTFPSVGTTLLPIIDLPRGPRSNAVERSKQGREVSRGRARFWKACASGRSIHSDMSPHLFDYASLILC